MEISSKYQRVSHPQREYSVSFLHQLRPNMKKAWPAAMRPGDGQAATKKPRPKPGL
jgi:hypothetical protein